MSYNVTKAKACLRRIEATEGKSTGLGFAAGQIDGKCWVVEVAPSASSARATLTNTKWKTEWESTRVKLDANGKGRYANKAAGTLELSGSTLTIRSNASPSLVQKALRGYLMQAFQTGYTGGWTIETLGAEPEDGEATDEPLAPADGNQDTAGEASPVPDPVAAGITAAVAPMLGMLIKAALPKQSGNDELTGLLREGMSGMLTAWLEPRLRDAPEPVAAVAASLAGVATRLPWFGGDEVRFMRDGVPEWIGPNRPPLAGRIVDLETVGQDPIPVGHVVDMVFDEALRRAEGMAFPFDLAAPSKVALQKWFGKSWNDDAGGEALLAQVTTARETVAKSFSGEKALAGLLGVHVRPLKPQAARDALASRAAALWSKACDDYLVALDDVRDSIDAKADIRAAGGNWASLDRLRDRMSSEKLRIPTAGQGDAAVWSEAAGLLDQTLRRLQGSLGLIIDSLPDGFPPLKGKTTMAVERLTQVARMVEQLRASTAAA